MKTILSMKLGHLHNGEHYEFENAVLEVFTPTVAANVNLTEQRALLQQTHDEEGEVYRANQAYRQTQTLTQLDAARDKKFNDIKFTVNFYLRMGDDAQKAAAAAVAFVLKPYVQGPVKGYQDNTAELGKFVTDMSVAPYITHIATLGLTETLAGLRADNDAFRTLYEVRAEEGLDRVGHEKIRALRHAFDDIWRIVAAVLPGAHFTETNPARKVVIGKAIDEINARILQTKRVLAARGMGSVAVGLVDVDHDHPEGPTTQPEGPEDEDDNYNGGTYIDPNA